MKTFSTNSNVLKSFFVDRPAVNLLGFCRECQISDTWFKKIKSGDQQANPEHVKQINKQLTKYGYGNLLHS